MGSSEEILEDPESEVASRVGNYELLDKLGEGGGRESFRARHIQSSRFAFVQVRRPESMIAGNASTLNRTVLTQLGHKHICRVMDVNGREDHRYIAMAFIMGESLEEMVRTVGPLPDRLVLRLGLRIASALEYLHQHGLAHCSLRPDHILIRRDGILKVAGLGWSRPIETIIRPGDARLFQEAPHFAAPEFLAPGAPVDRRADYYCLGALLYFLATAQAPFSEMHNPTRVLQRIARTAPYAPRKMNRDISRETSDLILAMMEKRPGDRPSCLEDAFAQMSQYLKACAGSAAE